MVRQTHERALHQCSPVETVARLLRLNEVALDATEIRALAGNPGKSIFRHCSPSGSSSGLARFPLSISAEPLDQITSPFESDRRINPSSILSTPHPNLRRLEQLP